MQQDRRHSRRHADRQALRDALANRSYPSRRIDPRMPSREATRRRGRGVWLLPPRARQQPAGETTAEATSIGARRGKPRCRGAALLDVMFTLAALMAGMQGFAQWQAAGGTTSAALGSATKAVAMASPVQAGGNAWLVHRQP
ncbi:hypothetical protein [Pandoraea fibrosis]|uniref:hypothetical protein n=1 Tax=Pandoraea fibrosis TaxID=1891094 RepID=UPI001240662F|nr:hypothetical protein [Pandoraea fibrosis]